MMVVPVDRVLQSIFLHLPIQTLHRFQLVCHHWNALISRPEFWHLRLSSSNNPAAGIFYRSTTAYIHYVAFDPPESAAKPEGLTMNNFSNKILHSCNGLLLSARLWSRGYFIHNPTMGYSSTLETPQSANIDVLSEVISAWLAFDPSVSPHFKLVCLRFVNPRLDAWFDVYSSETRSWGVISRRAAAAFFNFKNGVYWNGSIHWICVSNGHSLFLNVDGFAFGEMPILPTINNHYWEVLDWRKNHYFGESCGHLYFIPVGCWSDQLEVYEMKPDYSEWFVKYKIDLSKNPYRNRNPTSREFYVLALIEGRKTAFLVIRMYGRILRFDIVDQRYTTLRRYEGDGSIQDEDIPFGRLLTVSGVNGYQFIDSPARILFGVR